MKQKTFIFDLDGVIVDTAKYHFLAWQNLATQLGIHFTNEDNEQLKGVSRVRSLEIILGLGNQTASDEKKEKWLVQKNEEYLAYIEKMDESEILPDVKRVLQFLKDNNQKIVLGSASKNAKVILDKVHLTSYFDALVDGNAVSKAKPDPEVFLVGAKLTASTPENCIVFEDAFAGIQAANAANMLSIGIGDKAVLHEANYCFNDFTAISNEFLKELIEK
ncbi:beta-phosphoglucomutase [Flavobacterium sp.]|uniref:beta-phosphoglucomutase n=1 Tax=Flavobacterium sp. TaxID=239 RepID=UPI00352805C3